MDPNMVKGMSAPQLETYLDLGGDFQRGSRGMSHAKATSMIFKAMSGYMLEEINRFGPPNEYILSQWPKHLKVCKDSINSIDENLGFSSSGDYTLSCPKKKDVLEQFPKLDMIFNEIMNTLKTFSLTYDKQEASSSGSNSEKISYVYKEPRGYCQNQYDLNRFRNRCRNMRENALICNIFALEEMNVPSKFRLEKHGKVCLGSELYKCLQGKPSQSNTLDNLVQTEPSIPELDRFLVALPAQDLLETATKLEKVLHIWKLKKTAKPAKLEKYTGLIVNARYLLQAIQIRFADPDILTPFTSKKIEQNKDVGTILLENYSRTMEKMAIRVIELIDEVLINRDAPRGAGRRT